MLKRLLTSVFSSPIHLTKVLDSSIDFRKVSVEVSQTNEKSTLETSSIGIIKDHIYFWLPHNFVLYLIAITLVNKF